VEKSWDQEAATITFFSTLLGLHIEEFTAAQLRAENIKELFYTTVRSMMVDQ
jgi:hypothetical protein